MNEEQNIKQLPKDWKWVKLGEACEIVSGNTPKGLELISNKGQHQFYKVSDMNLVGNEIRMSVSNLKLTLEEIKKLKVKVYPKGTVIFPKRGGAILTNKKRVLSEDASFDLNLMGILPNDSLSSNYLFYWIQKLDLSKIYDGSNVPQINNKNVAPLDFPLPPKPTQQAIVSKIEELFSELDKGIENLRLAQQQLKTYRQAVLKWAFEGKLTNENMKDGELPEGWKQVKLNEMTESIQYGFTESSSKELIGPKFLRITDIQENKVKWDEVPYCKIDKKIKAKYLLKEGDLVFARTGATVGKSFLIKGEIPEAVFASYLIRVRVNKEIDEKYLSYFFHSPNYWSQITEGQVGIGQPNVNGTKLGQLDLILAPIKEQAKIVQEIESRLSVADKMEESITQSLQQSEALRQSILKKAFEGRLL
ncbi:MAG: restriction endonuclease subunit S [Chitinophagaceae bacterium]|nr:restriction endonuclease subunit S [Chitinophagaceae bacterium]